MEQYLLFLIVIAILQIATFVTAIVCYKKIKSRNEANFIILKNLISENQSDTINMIKSNEEQIINNLNTINNKSENILRELKEPLSLD